MRGHDQCSYISINFYHFKLKVNLNIIHIFSHWHWKKTEQQNISLSLQRFNEETWRCRSYETVSVLCLNSWVSDIQISFLYGDFYKHLNKFIFYWITTILILPANRTYVLLLCTTRISTIIIWDNIIEIVWTWQWHDKDMCDSGLDDEEMMICLGKEKSDLLVICLWFIDARFSLSLNKRNFCLIKMLFLLFSSLGYQRTSVNHVCFLFVNVFA